MTERFVCERNIKFLLHEVFDVSELFKYQYYEEHSVELFDMILETAIKIGFDVLRPALQEMDKNPPQFINDEVKVHPVTKTFMRTCGEGGWIGAEAPTTIGGLQFPTLTGLVSNFVFSAANYSASVYPKLTAAAAHLIWSFGNSELIEKYIQKMFSGEWQGTMALTEPQAGSSLGDIATTADLTEHGYYRITGQKIFISAAAHNGVGNVIQLLLAKIKDSPPGVKGISLFVVPNKRIEENGELISNDVSIAGIYHKLGYRGCPIVQLSLGENGDCRGYLVGEPNKGLQYMFQMMNEARIGVGIGATGIASAAYHAALEYTKIRTQGRKLNSKDPTEPQVPLIEHADVKRMLLFQRSVIEGSASLLFQCALYSDLSKVTNTVESKKYECMLDLLTPVAKSYPSEMGILSVSQALQCLGGYGYCDEFPLEQYYRDSRIHPIHEGTTGIHGITLLGRNILRDKGESFRLFLDEIAKAINAAKSDNILSPYAYEMEKATGILQDVTVSLTSMALKGKFDDFLADASLYLELFGAVAIAWQWLLQGISARRALNRKISKREANFYEGKIYVLRYFFLYELPKSLALSETLKNEKKVTVEMSQEHFFY